MNCYYTGPPPGPENAHPGNFPGRRKVSRIKPTIDMLHPRLAAVQRTLAPGMLPHSVRTSCPSV